MEMTISLHFVLNYNILQLYSILQKHPPTEIARLFLLGIFPFIETSYTVPSTLLRISKLGLGGSIVYV